LAVLRVPAASVASELPDLRESWAWAHTQVIAPTSADTTAISSSLSTAPVLNVSRIVCPRRLQPQKHYVAALVPAFRQGVERGLGIEPSPGDLAPAWDINNPGALELPVYYQWEFSTGPKGDFESLARKLRAFKCPATVGLAPMFLGASQPELPVLDANSPDAYRNMEGALRAPSAVSTQLSDIIPALQDSIRDAVDLPARVLARLGEDRVTAIGPPLYGEWHANRHTVPETQPFWMHELNLDPRTRAAAALGADVVRANQEDFMQSCWEQIGKLPDANDLLSRGRFSLEANLRLYVRHYQKLPADRLLEMTAAVHVRTPQASATLAADLGKSSVPNAAIDPAMRRMLSPQRKILRAAARRAGFAAAPSGSWRNRLFESLANGRADVDPNRFVPDGVAKFDLGAKVGAGPETGNIDLSRFGLAIQVEAASIRAISESAQIVGAAAQRPASALKVRTNLRQTGLVTATHISKVIELEGNRPGTVLSEASANLVRAAIANPGAAGFLFTREGDIRSQFEALDIDAQGRMFLRTRLHEPSILVGRMPTGTMRAGSNRVSDVLRDLPARTVSRNQPVDISIGPIGDVIVTRPPTAGPSPVVETNTIPKLLQDVTAISRFEAAFQKFATDAKLDVVRPEPKIVPFDVNSARAVVLDRLNPAVMVPLRVQGMLTVAGTAILRDLPLWLRVPETMDRIMAAPELPAPTYTYLTKLDKDSGRRFLPGSDGIPVNAITLVETNPRFIEAFMVGLNHEMNRELLWRRYPTDQRGTPFRHFWDWFDGAPDLTLPIHRWPENSHLGDNLRGAGQGGQIVLLIRGELLLRYPNTIVFAWRGVQQAPERFILKDPPEPGDTIEPVFRGKFDPDFAFFGFPLRDTDLASPGGWFFVIQEQPTEPRFGFDEPDAGPAGLLTRWSDASWDHAGTAPGGYLTIGGNPLTGRSFGGVTFATNSAHLATLSLQQPMRVATHSRHIVQL